MSDVERMRSELVELERECERRLSSARYRMGALLVDTARDWRQWPRFPVRAWRLWRTLRARRRPAGPGSPAFEEMRARIRSFAREVREKRCEQVLFVFAGTTHIQGVRGNRPIRQALEARRFGIPVLFSYHRTRYDDPLPPGDDAGLLQLPVDMTMQLLSELARLELGASRRIFLVSYPLAGIEDRIADFRAWGWAVLYDCRDDWEEFRKVGMASWYKRRVERRVVAGCHATMCVSDALCEKMRSMVPGARVLLSPNAVDSALLRRRPAKRGPIEPPQIGYFGHLSAAWFDWPALINVARLRPRYRFKIIGHSAPAGLDLPGNLQLGGPQSWHRLEQLATHWSAAIIPFRMGPLADGVDPIKVYEYLAFGLPVVSFRMAQIERYPGVKTVDSEEAFARALDAACENPLDDATVEEFLSRNTWRIRIKELLRLAHEVRAS